MDSIGIMEGFLQRRPGESRRAAATNCQRPVGPTLLTQLSQEYHREAGGRLAETTPQDGPGDSEASSPTLSLAESRRGGMAADEQSCVAVEDDDDDQLLSASQVVVTRRGPFSDILSHLEAVRPPVLPSEPANSKVTTWLKKSHRYLVAKPDSELDVGTEGEKLQNLMIASPGGAKKRPELHRTATTGPRFFKTRLGPDRWLALAPVASAATDKADDDPYLFVDSQQSRNVRPPASSRRSSRRGARFRRRYVRRDVVQHFVCKARRDAPPRSPDACGQEVVASPLKTPKDFATTGTQSSFMPNSVDVFDALVAKSPLRPVCNVIRTPRRSSSSDSDDFLFGTPTRRRCAHKKENVGSDTRRLSLNKSSTESKEPFPGLSGIVRRRRCLSSAAVPSRRSPRLPLVRNVTKEQTVTVTTAAGRAKMAVSAYRGLTGIRTTPFASVAYSVGQQSADDGKTSESFAGSLPASQVSTVKWNNEDHLALEGSEAGVRASSGDRPACRDGGGGASVAPVHHSAAAMSGGVLLGIQKGKVFGCAADLDEIAEGPVEIGSSKADGEFSAASTERTPDVPSTVDGPRRSLGVECAGGSTDPPRDEVERGFRCHSSTAIAEVVFNTGDQVSTCAAAAHHGALNASPVNVVREVSAEVSPPSIDPRTLQPDAHVPMNDGAPTKVQTDKILSNDDCCPAAMTLIRLPLPVELRHGVSPPPLVRFMLAGRLQQRFSVDGRGLRPHVAGRTSLLIASGSRARTECPYCGSVVNCRPDRPNDGDEVVRGRAEVMSRAVQTSDSGSPMEQVALPSGVGTCRSAPPLSPESGDDEICLSSDHDTDVIPAVPQSPGHPVINVIGDRRVVPSVPSPDSDVSTLDPFTLNRQAPSSVATDNGSFPMDVDSEELTLLCADATPAGVRRRCCRPSTPNSGAGSVHSDALRSERGGSASCRRYAHEEVLDTMLDVVEVAVEGRALPFVLMSVSKTGDGSKDAVGRHRPERDAGARQDLSCRSKVCPEDRAPSTGSPQMRTCKTVRGLASGRFPFIFCEDCPSLVGDLGVSGEGVRPEGGGAAATSSSGRVGKLWEQSRLSPSGGEIVVPPTPRPSSQSGAGARRCLLRALDSTSNASEARNGTANGDETGRATPKNLVAPSSTTAASQKRNWEAWSVDDDECVVVKPKRRNFRRIVLSSSSPSSDSGGEQRRPIRSFPMPDDGGQSPELLVEDTDSAVASSPRRSPDAGLYVPETEDSEVWPPLPMMATFDGVLADVVTEPGVAHGSDGPDTCDLALEGAELEFGPTALLKCRAAGSWSLGEDTLDLGVSGNRWAADHPKATAASGGAVTAFHSSVVSGLRSDLAGVPDGAAALSLAEDRGVTGQTDEDSTAKSDTKTGVELQCSGFGLSPFSELSTDAEFLNTQAREQLKQDIDAKMASIRMLEEQLKTAEIQERQQLHWSSVVSKDPSPALGGRHDWRCTSYPVAACRTVPEEPAAAREMSAGRPTSSWLIDDLG